MSDVEKSNPGQQLDFRLGDWHVMPGLNRIRKNGESVSLQHLSMQVLVYLSNRVGHVVSYDELLNSLWPNRVASDDAVHRRIADLRRNLGDETREPKYIETISKRGYRLIAAVRPVAENSEPVWRRPILIAAAVVAALMLATLILKQNTADHAINAARLLIAVDDYTGAYLKIRPLLGTKETDTALGSLLEEINVPVSIESSPANAEVFYRLYGQPDDDWKILGVTPFETVLPRSTWLLRFVADAHDTVELALPNPSMAFNNVGRDYYVVKLPPSGTVPDDMVFVPGGKLFVPLLGFRQAVDLGDFYIGKTEVNNAKYAEFLNAGGYQNPEYWSDLPGISQGIQFSQVSTRFVDSTGLPGPAGWNNGSFRDGSEDEPVTGVSWYEAMAYARYRGMTLPTARHWARAALGIDESRWPLAPALIPEAHLQGPKPIGVAEGNALSTWGALNLIGNVREWTVSYAGEHKLNLGASFRGPAWNYALPEKTPPLRRNPDQGIRLAKYDESIDNPPLGLNGEPPAIPDVTTAEYAEYERSFRYVPDLVNADSAELVSEVEEESWIRRKILIATKDADDPMPVLIFLPKNSDRPLQTVVFYPPGDSYTGGLPSNRIDITRYNIDFIVTSGRALIWPILVGTHERVRPQEARGSAKLWQRWYAANLRRRDETGRLLDYLQGNPQFDSNRIGLLAASFGATFVVPHILASESRFRSAVLISSSLAGVSPEKVADRVNPNTYWPHVRTPILLLNGRFDVTKTYLPTDDTMISLIGTAENDKRSIYYDSSHWPLPAHRVRNDTLEWFDQYLGFPAASSAKDDRRYQSD